MSYSAIYPGRTWLDTDGKRIQAHGGSVIYVDGTYYWYGENKEKTDGLSEIWHWGVRCYSSTDLYNWQDRGLILPPDLTDELSPLNPASMMDRPHIVYNQRTQKFVCWIKIMYKAGLSVFGGQTEAVYTADDILGPYTLIRKDISPMGMSAGDFDIAIAEDGKAYCYYERVHGELICADLNEDYTDYTGYYSTHFPGKIPPDSREAPAHFMRKGHHYLITSGTTWYFPNPSEAAIADTWHGPFTVQGDPHVNDPSHTSFHSQISSIFKVVGKKDLYIACADRWLPEAMDLKFEEYSRAVREMHDPDCTFDPSNYSFTQPVAKTCIADYVWLPLQFEGDLVRIEWKDSWRIEDYD